MPPAETFARVKRSLSSGSPSFRLISAAGPDSLTAPCTPAIVHLATVEALTAERCPHDTSSSVGRHTCLLAGLVSGAGDCRKKPIQRTARGFQMRVPGPSLTSPVSPVAARKFGTRCGISAESLSALLSFPALAICPYGSPLISAKLQGALSQIASNPPVPGLPRLSTVCHDERPPNWWRAFRVITAKTRGWSSSPQRCMALACWNGLFPSSLQQLFRG